MVIIFVITDFKQNVHIALLSPAFLFLLTVEHNTQFTVTTITDMFF